MIYRLVTLDRTFSTPAYLISIIQGLRREPNSEGRITFNSNTSIYFPTLQLQYKILLLIIGEPTLVVVHVRRKNTAIQLALGTRNSASSASALALKQDHAS